MKKTVTPMISVLMLNWNGYHYTKKCVDSLLKSDYKNFEIVIFDNGSDNNEFEKLSNNFEKVKNVLCFSNPYNLGYARGMNEAFKKSSGDYIMISNNDMKYESDCLSELSKILSNMKNVGVCQPKLLKLGNKKKFDYSIAAGGYVDVFGYPFARGRIFTFIESDNHQYDTISKISWCGIFLAKKEVIKKIGFFNPIYFNYGEDMDFCFRVYASGHSIVNVPSAIAYHVSGGVLKKNMLAKLFFHHRNNIILMLVNWPMKYLIILFPLRVLMDFVTIFYYISVDFVVGAHGILNAYLSLIRLFPQIISERRKTMRQVRYALFKRVPIYKGSIAVDFFLRKKRRFSQINIGNKIVNLD